MSAVAVHWNSKARSGLGGFVLLLETKDGKLKTKGHSDIMLLPKHEPKNDDPYRNF